MTYCETCLQYTFSTNCLDPYCGTEDAATLERRAFQHLSHKGYWLHQGNIYKIDNDDDDNWQDHLIAAWPGGAADAFRQLMRHGFPQTENIDCGQCHQNPVEFLGDDCYDCADEKAQWAKADIALERN